MPPARGEVAQNFVAGGLFVLEVIVKTGSDTRDDFPPCMSSQHSRTTEEPQGRERENKVIG